MAFGASAAVADVDCLVTAHRTVDVGAAVSGLVGEVLVDRGDVVSKGQLLFSLDDRVAQTRLRQALQKAENDQNVLAARARLELAEKATVRYEQLRLTESAAFNDTLYQEALAEAQVAAISLRNAELEQEALRLDLDRLRTEITLLHVQSPISGVVVARHLSEGEYRSERDAVVTIAGIDPLHVEAYLPSDAYGSVSVKNVLTLELGAPILGSKPAVVDVVDQMIDPASRTFGVRLVLENADHSIPSGIGCRLNFDAD
jgi:RND family efflux transporter MFP subunit